MEFRVLGPVQVLRDGVAVAVGGGRQKAVLAVLLCHANTWVSRPRVRDLTWGDPPDSATVNLRTYVGRLRTVLNDGTGSRLESEDGKLRFRVAAGESDLLRFRELDAQGDARVAAGEHGEAARCFAEALKQWRGDPFEKATVDAPLGALVAELGEARAETRRKRYRSLVHGGDYDEAIIGLRSAVVLEPLAENLVELLMLALYRSGRVDEALAVFHDTRAHLIDELGIDPSRHLAEMHRRILSGEEPLSPHPIPSTSTSGTPHVIPAQLPADIPVFTGRGRELETICSAARGTHTGALIVSSIEGMAGIGKTALAVHAATRLSADFPDGQLFIDLHGFDADASPTDPASALERLLRGLGVEERQIPSTLDERAALYRSMVNDRRILIVLDNANNEYQVAPLLPGGDTSLAIVTSRRSLAGLDQARPVRIDLLSQDEAVSLLTAVIGSERVSTPSEAVAVVEACGRLPLAIRIAATRLRNRPNWTLAFLLERLTDTGLNELSSGGHSVSAAFELSYAELDEPARVMFRRLGLHPGHDFDVHAAAALADQPLMVGQRLLDELVDTSLLVEHTRGRYRFHDLVGAYATAKSMTDDTEDERSQAVVRMLEMYLDSMVASHRLIEATTVYRLRTTREAHWVPVRPETRNEVLEWYAIEHDNLEAMVGFANTAGHHEHAWRIVANAGKYFRLKHMSASLLETSRIGLASAEVLNDSFARGVMLKQLGIAQFTGDDLPAALQTLNRALDQVRQTGSTSECAEILYHMGQAQRLAGSYDESLASFDNGLELLSTADHDASIRASLVHGRAMSFHRSKDYERSGHAYATALDLYRRAGHENSAAYALHNLGLNYRERGCFHDAAACHRETLEFFERENNPYAIASALVSLGAALTGLGEYDAAIQYQVKSLDIRRQEGWRSQECRALAELGDTYVAAGRLNQAIESFSHAESIARHIGFPHEQAAASFGLGKCQLRTGAPTQAQVHLRNALTIFEDLALPDADDVRDHLANLDMGAGDNGCPE